MKCLKSLTAMVLIACMTFSVPVEAAVDRTNPQERTVSADKDETEKEYAKGQALILYKRPTDSARASIASHGFGADMQIEETYEFDGVGQDMPARMARSREADTTAAFQVSLVKSDKYSTEELIKQLNARKDIIAAEPNYKLHTLDMGQDPYVKYQWAIDNQGQNHGTVGLDVKPKQEILGTNPAGKEYVIALVDTGMDYTHEDLQDVVWENPLQSNQLRGRHGYDFINGDADPMDDNGHGTHCSGIMAANHNNIGVQGVTDNENIKIMPLKILDERGSGYGIEFVGAYNYIYKAQQLGVNVVAVNNSWGGVDEEESVIFQKLVELVGEKGAVSVCAAGNDGTNNDALGGDISAIDSDAIIAVAATNENDEMATFSNYGAESVDLAAPGADILSTVCYDCFNPGIYENREELCSIFEDFSDGNLVKESTGNADDIVYGFAKSKGRAKLSLSLTDETCFGLKGDGEKSLKWSINNAREDDIYTLYFPYTAGISTTGTHDSIMIKAIEPDRKIEGTLDELLIEPSIIYVNDFELTEEGALDSADKLDMMKGLVGGAYIDKGNYWNHFSGLALEEREEEQKRALAVTLSASVSGNYEIYLDNLGISKENVAEEKFGKYDYYDGTSMAAPYVTGAVAALASAYPQDDARDRKERLLGCTRKTNALQGKVLTGGVLDLSHVKEPNVYLKNISLDDKKNICIEGRGLAHASVTVNNQAAVVKEQSENRIVLNSAGFLNHALEITVAAEGKSMNRNCFFSDGAAFAHAGDAMGTVAEGYTVSDGNRIYYVDAEGMVATCNPEQKDEDGEIMYLEGDMGYHSEIFGKDEEFILEYSVRNLSDIACLDDRLWSVIALEMMYSEERVLACYDSEEGWQKACNLPKEFETLEGISLAAYQGKLYLFGGLDNLTGKEQTVVMRMDPLTRKWEKASSLPEARAFAKAVTIGNELILTLGRKEDGTFPRNMIYNGKSWKMSQTQPEGLTADGVYTYYNENMEEKEVIYYSANVGAVKGGLVYTGVEAENLGDTFFYQLSSDKYVKSGYAISNTAMKEPTQQQAVVMRDKLYLLTQEGEDVHVYAMPVQGLYVEVVSADSEEWFEGGTLSGIRYYVPGDVISVTAEPEEGYFVKRLLVNGTKVEKGANGKYQYRCAVDLARKKMTASVEFGAYVLMLLAEEETLDLFPGQSCQTNIFVIPENADNQELIWSSSKPGMVSVNKKTGNIKVSKKAKLGSTAVITVTAADRKTVKININVKVVKRPLPSKGEIVNVGKLQYEVTSSAAKKKTVSCNGFAGKAIPNVKIPAIVRINGYIYKVTGISKNAFAKNKKIKSVTMDKYVTSIGQNAFYNCSSLKSVRIKGTSIKKIGKSAFKGVSKSSVVRVPKKVKRSYTAKLKKAGFVGTVK